MDDTVAYGMNLGFILDHAVVLAEQHGKYVFDCHAVIEDFSGQLDRVVVVPCIGEHGTAHADTVHETFCESGLRFRFDELVFD
jgi:hypothetical protein